MNVCRKNNVANSVAKFIDYKPADLRTKNDWIIVYYVKNPLSQKLDRFRLRVPQHENEKERLKLGKNICLNINKKLQKGWSPYLDTATGKDYKTFKDCADLFLDHIEKELIKGDKRADTLRSYKSHIDMLYLFQEKKKVKLVFVLEMNKEFVNNYLDWIYYERSNSARTHNNHLFFVRTFTNYLISRGFMIESPVKDISPKMLASKKRQALTKNLKKILSQKLPEHDHNFFTICMMTYYCLIRRTEATKLIVGNVNLDKDYIFIPATISKNKKDEYVTIPNEFKPILQKHIGNADDEDYLFGKLFIPGKQILQPKKISDEWIKIRTMLNFDSKYQFYSLKDTGIMDLLEAGIPAIKVRDQARHYDIKITEGYTARNNSCDEVVKNSGILF